MYPFSYVNIEKHYIYFKEEIIKSIYEVIYIHMCVSVHLYDIYYMSHILHIHTNISVCPYIHTIDTYGHTTHIYTYICI